MAVDDQSNNVVVGVKGNNCTTKRRSYWRFGKKDLFPEQSFNSWSDYRSALSATIPRLRERFLHRSEDADETHALRLRSENTMSRCLNWWDLAWLGFGAVVGSGIFVITGQEARYDAGPAIVLSYAASGFSALLSVFCYAEFAVEIPSAGGSFSYLRVELGEFVAFIAAANILLEAVVGAAGLGRAWTSYFATLINREPDSLRIHVPRLAEGFNLLDPIAVAILGICSTIAMMGTRGTSKLNWITSLITVGIIAFIIVAGLLHANPSENLTPFLPFGAQGVFRAAAVVYWSYTGFDMTATMAEETKNPSKDIPLGLVGSMTSITVVYCVMALVISMMQKYSAMDPNAVFSVAFASVGMRWAKYLVALGALKGMTTGLLVGSLGQARYTTQIARAHMIPPYFALVHPNTRTPVYATLLVTIPAACVGFFSSLDVIASVSSISTLFIFTLISIALLVRRHCPRQSPLPQSTTIDHDHDHDQENKTHLYKFLVFLLLILCSSIGISAYWGCNADNNSNWIGYAVLVPLWFLGTLGMKVFVPEKKAPKVWGVPFVPWLPSLSIAINLFLMGSLGYKAYVRFGICTLFMVVYYVFFGLHASYDAAQQHNQRQPEEVVDDDGGGSVGFTDSTAKDRIVGLKPRALLP